MQRTFVSVCVVLRLATQVLCRLSHAATVILRGVTPFNQAGLDSDPPMCVSCVAEMTGVHHHILLLLVEMEGVLQTLCPGWPQTMIFQISTS
jgi:hypothetical protein